MCPQYPDVSGIPVKIKREIIIWHYGGTYYNTIKQQIKRNSERK